MAKPERRGEIVTLPVLRPGEGTQVSISLRTRAGTDGSTQQIVGIDLNEAPVPERQFVTTTADIVYENETAMFLFGQMKINSTALRSLLILTMPIEKLSEMVASINSLEKPNLPDILQEMSIQTQALTKVTAEPAQTLPVVANLCGVAISGRETVMDFFHLSAYGALSIKSGHKVAINPIVRIHIGTGLFAGLVKRMDEICNVERQTGVRRG